MADPEASWLDEAFSEPDGEANAPSETARDERDGSYDWIDDAFDDEKTARDIANAKSMKPVGCLLGVVIVAAVVFCVFALGGVIGALR